MLIAQTNPPREITSHMMDTQCIPGGSIQTCNRPSSCLHAVGQQQRVDVVISTRVVSSTNHRYTWREKGLKCLCKRHLHTHARVQIQHAAWLMWPNKHNVQTQCCKQSQTFKHNVTTKTSRTALPYKFPTLYFTYVDCAVTTVLMEHSVVIQGPESAVILK